MNQSKEETASVISLPVAFGEAEIFPDCQLRFTVTSISHNQLTAIISINAFLVNLGSALVKYCLFHCAFQTRNYVSEQYAMYR